jgi:hypothetical protein
MTRRAPLLPSLAPLEAALAVASPWPIPVRSARSSHQAEDRFARLKRPSRPRPRKSCPERGSPEVWNPRVPGRVSDTCPMPPLCALCPHSHVA